MGQVRMSLLRQPSSDAQALFRRSLKGKRTGYKFIPGLMVQGWFLDYYNAKYGVVIQVEGAGHDRAGQAEADCDAALALAKIRVLHLTEAEIETDLPAVIGKIRSFMGGPPTHVLREGGVDGDSRILRRGVSHQKKAAPAPAGSP